MSDKSPSLWLLRHGETDWTILGRHTGRTDLSLTPRGVREAALLGRRIYCHSFALILTSPLLRASETARLAGYGNLALVEPNLQEWHYGDYEGMTTAAIREERPGWSIWKDGAPGGESPEEVGERADRVIERVLAADGDVALFAHGHLLRVLAARWLEQDPAFGGSIALDTASLSILGVDRGQRIIRYWNEVCHLGEE